MTYEVYRSVFIICGVLSSVLIVAAIVLFLTLKIPVAIGDITGVNERKAIENIRKQNAVSGEKLYKSRTLLKANPDALGGAMATSWLETQQLLQETAILSSAEETTAADYRESIFEIEFDITYIHSDELIV